MILVAGQPSNGLGLVIDTADVAPSAVSLTMYRLPVISTSPDRDSLCSLLLSGQIIYRLAAAQLWRSYDTVSRLLARANISP
jgi:hypothetical protein